MVVRFTFLRFRLFRHSLITLPTALLLPLLGRGQQPVGTWTATRPAAAVYTWSATGNSASWSDAASWTPSRTTPAATDILQFSAAGATTAVLDFSSTQTISRLVVQSGSAITFSTDGERTLTVSDGSTGSDLIVESNAQLTLYHNNSASLSNTHPGLALKLGTGATASIGGRLALDAYQSNVSGSPTQNTVQGSGTTSLEFANGSTFTAQTNFTGNAFGSSAALANSVVFRNGARYEQLGGSHPFALSQPSTVVSFEPASTYYFAGSSMPSLSGRTYGNLEYNAPNQTVNGSGAGQLTIAGNLTVTAGTVGINVTGGVLLKGNVLLNGGTLAFNPGSASTVQFGGTAPQRIGGGAGNAPTFGANATLQVNNAAGLTQGQPVSVAGVLQLTSGLLTTDATNILTLAQTATVTDGSDASFVNGPVRRPVGTTTSATSYVFPVGKGSAYRPLTLLVNTQTGTTNYRAEQFEGSAGGTLANPDASGTNLARISRVRYFSLTPYSNDVVPVVAQPVGFTGNLRLSFNIDDAVTNPATTTLVIAKRSSNTQPWSNFGRAGYVGTSSGGTLTSGTITTFSDFALASTDPDRSANPLPVQLTAFTATRTAGGQVALAWTTASELNSARFEVERSLDGHTFAQIAQVAARGSSTQARRYASCDEAAPAMPLYYRLRLVDLDGTCSYSAAVLAAGPVAELALSPNPAHEQVSFYTKQPTPYILRSAVGQVLRLGTTATGLTQLEMGALPAGVYFLELHTSEGRVLRRFVKE